MPNLGLSKKIISYKTAFTVTVVLFVTLATINLVGTNALATKGFAVNESEIQTIGLEKENRILSVKIEEATQLKELESYAEQNGYTRSTRIVFVPNTPPTFASR